MKRDQWFLALLALVLLLFTALDPEAGLSISRFFRGSAGSGTKELTRLALENAALKAEVVKLEDAKRQLSESSAGYVAALVYSRYPFNLRNEFLITAGKTQSLQGGEAVVFERVLIGKIDRAFEDTSVVQTIFDERWQSSVRIGSQGVEALLLGGTTPKLTLIAKAARVASGDAVYSSASGFPYGLAIGEIKEIRLGEDQLFQEAAVKFPYDLGEIHAISVAR